MTRKNIPASPLFVILEFWSSGTSDTCMCENKIFTDLDSELEALSFHFSLFLIHSQHVPRIPVPTTLFYLGHRKTDDEYVECSQPNIPGDILQWAKLACFPGYSDPQSSVQQKMPRISHSVSRVYKQHREG